VKWAILSITLAQTVLLRVLFGFLPLFAYALATGALNLRDWRHAHHFALMSVLATAFYYFAFAKGTALLRRKVEVANSCHALEGAIPASSTMR